MKSTMQALVKSGRTLSLRPMPRPVLHHDDVLVHVVAAGLCRTDLYVADGLIPGPDPLILGHEFAGYVEEVGATVQNVVPGNRVAIMPIIPCRGCGQCRQGLEATCLERQMLGVDRHGAFAEWVAVPGHVVYPLPDALSFRMGAYMEPIAAAMAVLKTGIQPSERGLIYGQNRIAQLIQRILHALCYANIETYPSTNKKQSALPANAYDYIIETSASTETLAELIRAVRPLGLIILKSRHYRPAGIHLIDAVKKELTFRAVNYGSFADAIELAASGRLDVSDLLGSMHPLADFEAVFAQARRNESQKCFFVFGDDDVRHL